jgi:hypothetical protein
VSGISEDTPKDIVKLGSGPEILRQLLAHWYLMLGSTKSDAATFFLESPPAVSSGKILSFYQYTTASLSSFCKPFPVKVYDPELGAVLSKSPVDLWLESPKRKGVRRITFEPGFPRTVDGALNLWTGFAKEPLHDNAKCARFLQHVKEVIANNDDEVYEYILSWMATRVQGIHNRKPNSPLKRMVVAIVLRSVQGSGKSLFELYFAAIFGHHALVTGRGHGLTGRFNFEFANLALLCADEAFFAGNHTEQDILKSFQTEPVFSFEKKYSDSVSLPNHAGTIMTTNKAWAIPADAAERRMAVYDVSDARLGDREYFKALAAEKDGDGPSALLGFLLKRDLTGFNIEDFPRSDALVEQQVQTLSRDSTTMEWLHEALETGWIDVGYSTAITDKDGNFSKPEFDSEGRSWPEKKIAIRRDWMGTKIRAYASSVRQYRPPSNETIGRELKKAIGASTAREGTEVDGKRPWLWVLPPYSVAKKRFDEYLATGRFTY